MLGLPKSTELNKQLPKNAIFAKFQMNNAAKEHIDKDISRIYIVNEISASKVNTSEGEEVKTFFVLLVQLKRKDFDEKNIITISKLIPQNMVLVLEYEDKIKCAVYHTRLIQTEWKEKDSFVLKLNGLNLDKVWENIIIQIGDLQIEEGNSVAEQITLNEQRNKLKKEIDRLEKLARKEVQPKKKFDIVSKIKELKEQLDSLRKSDVPK